MKEQKNKPKLKSMLRRKPDATMKQPGFITELSSLTGFREGDIRKVLTFAIFVMRRELMKKVQVRIPRIGTIYPCVKRSRMVNRFAGPGSKEKPTPMRIPDRWQIKLQPNRALVEDMKTLEVTQEELSKLTK